MSSSSKELVYPIKMNVRDFCGTDLRNLHCDSWQIPGTLYLISFALGPRAQVSFPECPVGRHL
jgi:hypothetical protein